MWALFLVASAGGGKLLLSHVSVGSAALLTTPPVTTLPSVIHLPDSIIRLPHPSVIHLPASATATPRRGVRNLLAAPRSRPLLPVGWQPAGLLSWSGASTFRALVTLGHSLSVVCYSGGTRHTSRTRQAKSLGWEPRAGLLSWRGASTFRAIVKRNTCLAMQLHSGEASVARAAGVP